MSQFLLKEILYSIRADPVFAGQAQKEQSFLMLPLKIPFHASGFVHIGTILLTIPAE
jgi:hypothetical protein